MRIGFSGHQDMPVAARQQLVDALKVMIAQHPTAQVSCALAAGSDQLVARTALRLDASLDVVVPCQGYEKTFETSEQRREYEELRLSARRVTMLPFPEPGKEAFMAAGVVVAERCDKLLAAWDGKPSAGLGGTADVVNYCRQIGRPVEVAWPTGLTR